jgi:hypothetical protein
MSLQIGRFGVELLSGEVQSFTANSSRVSISGVTSYSDDEAARALRQQLLGYVDSPDESFVPVVWDEHPEVDGYHEVARVSWDELDHEEGLWNFSVELDRVQGYASPLIEVVSTGATRQNSRGLTRLDRRGVPGACKSFAIYVPDLNVYISPVNVEARPSATGEVLLYETQDAPLASYTVEPARFYDGAVTVKVGDPLRTAVGRQIPNLPRDWELSNGLLRVTTQLGSLFDLTLQAWDGSTWGPGWSVDLFGGNPHSALRSPHTITVLRNSPEEAVLRFTTTFTASPDDPIVIDIALRRGHRFISVRHARTVLGANKPAVAAGFADAVPVPGGLALPGAVAAKNLSSNPRLATNATGWSMIGAGTATGRQTGVGPIGSITAWYRVTAAAAHSGSSFGAAHQGAGVIPVVAGTTDSFSVYARPSVSRDLSLRVVFYDASGNQVGGALISSAVAVNANTWARLNLNAIVVPSGAVRASVGAVGGFATWAAGQTLDVTGTQPEPGTVATAYFDGSTSDTGGFIHAWTGEAHSSPSTRFDATTVDAAVIGAPYTIDHVFYGSGTVHPYESAVIAVDRWDFCLGLVSAPGTLSELADLVRDYMSAGSDKQTVVAR